MPSMNGTVLTAHEATIQTAQVEIQVLKVGKKQVTMGLFRQLPLRNIQREDTGQLLAWPWGRVNYWWDGDDVTSPYDHRPHRDGSRLHLVWEDAGVLYRDILYKEPKYNFLHSYDDALDSAAVDLYIALLDQGATWAFTGSTRHFNYERAPITATFEIDGEAITLTVQHDRPDIGIAHAYRYDLTSGALHEAALALSLRNYEAMLQKRGLVPLNLASCRVRYDNARARRQHYIDTWAAQWDALMALPQLFIAV